MTLRFDSSSLLLFVVRWHLRHSVNICFREEEKNSAFSRFSLSLLSLSLPRFKFNFSTTKATLTTTQISACRHAAKIELSHTNTHSLFLSRSNIDRSCSFAERERERKKRACCQMRALDDEDDDCSSRFVHPFTYSRRNSFLLFLFLLLNENGINLV